MDQDTPHRGMLPVNDDDNGENLPQQLPDDDHSADTSLNPSYQVQDDEPFDPLERGFAPDLEATPSTGATPISSSSDAEYLPPELPPVPPLPQKFGDDPLQDVDLEAFSVYNQDGREQPRASKARDRIARRKGQTPSSENRPSPVRNLPPLPRNPRDPANVLTRGITSARSAARGAASTANKSMPVEQIKLPISRTGLYVIGSIVFIVLVVIVLGEIRNRPDEVHPNMLWIGTEWTYEVNDEASVAAFVEHLRTHKIGTVYAWVSWLQPDNTWRGQDNFANVQAFVQQFHELYPEGELFGWVSLPVEGDGIPYRLNDVAVQNAVASFSRRVIDEFGFEGVYLNVEPVWNNDQNFLDLLRRVRTAVGQNVSISVAIPPDWSPLDADIPVPPLIIPGTVWDTTYKQSVALLVDQLAVMAYNSGLTSPSDYVEWMAYQVETFANAVDQINGGTTIFIGIPTYDAELPGHDPAVENVITAVEGVKNGLEQAGTASRFVRGLAIYAGWTTDEQEWSDFMVAWLR